jgi:hypothetical protein
MMHSNATEAAEELQDYYEKFGETIKILPSFGNHVPPDLQHLVLQTITLTIIIVTIIAAIALFHLQSKNDKMNKFDRLKFQRRHF